MAPGTDHLRRVRHSVDVAAASWIGPRLAPFGPRVGSNVPQGFEAYARVLHPVGSDPQRSLRWADVATRTGRVAHACMQFSAIKGGHWPGEEPQLGSLRHDQIELLAEILAGRTETPEQCWFCLWEGQGWIWGGTSYAVLTTAGGRVGRVPPAFEPEVLTGPRVHLPGRDYLLFAGPVSAAGAWPSSGSLPEQSPNLWWPQDRAWCVASEIDFDSTLVGGSEELIGDLLAEPALETWRIAASDSLAADADSINR